MQSIVKIFRDRVMPKITGNIPQADSVNKHAKSCVNYVWLNKNPLQTQEQGPLCGINLTLIDLAYKNAKRYPKIDVNIWIDYDLLDQQTKFFMQSHAYLKAPANVTLHDINDVPSYQIIKDLAPDPCKDNIWKRVDLARLLVLEHCFNTQPDKDYMIYADFDVDDIKLNNRKVWHCLDTHNICLPVANNVLLENSYMAFKRGDGSNYLSHIFIPDTIAWINMNAENGYGSFVQAAHKVAEDQNVHLSSLVPDTHIVEATGYRVEPDLFYLKNNLN